MTRLAHREGLGRPAPVWLLLILAASLAMRCWYLDQGLDANRFWDERFSFDNVAQLLESGGLEPRNGYYPLLSYLPQGLLLAAADALHGATGADWLAVRDGGRFTAEAYRLARLVQTVWGVATVWLIFLIGRRLFGDAVGLVAAAAAAFAPGLIHASAVFKPDAPLVLAVLATFLWSLAAARRPTAGRYALAGGGVALAMSTKLTGGLAALPVVFVSLLRGRREPRRLLLLALAGAVTLALFLLLNPHWPLYFDYLEKVSLEYRWKAQVRQMTRWQAPGLIAGFLATNLGLLGLGVAAVAGAALLARLARRRRDDGAGAAMLLFFPLAYASGYVAKTAQFKHNNFLPILPFVILVVAWGLVEGWRRLAPRSGGPLLLAAWLAAGALFVPRGVLFVHRSLTPTAEDMAIRFANRLMNGHPACWIVYEPGRRRWPPWELYRPPGACRIQLVDRLAELPAAELRLADGVLFPLRRLHGEHAQLYLDAVADSSPGQTAVHRRHGLSLRGPGFVAALYPWAEAAPPRTLELDVRNEGRFRLQAPMPAEVAAGDVVSFVVRLPGWALAEELPPPRLRMGDNIVDLIYAGNDERGAVFITPRLVSRQPAPHAKLNRRRLAVDGQPVRLELWRWRR